MQYRDEVFSKFQWDVLQRPFEYDNHDMSKCWANLVCTSDNSLSVVCGVSNDILNRNQTSNAIIKVALFQALHVPHHKVNFLVLYVINLFFA